MKSASLRRILIKIYAVVFAIYMLAPLAVMGGAAVNNSRFPSVYPWVGLTPRWFGELWSDARIWTALLNTGLVAFAVVVLSVPTGIAAALLLNSLRARLRSVLYGFMVAPILTPGTVIGIATILFWNKLDVPVGMALTVIGQSSFISAYAMLLILARLQSFDASLAEAALDLGASHWQVFRRIVIPHLYPAAAAAAAVAFFQSVENFNVTLFTAGDVSTLTVYVFSQIRAGVTPKINALALIMMVLTMIATVLYEIRRRHMTGRKATEAIDGEEEGTNVRLPDRLLEPVR